MEHADARYLRWCCGRYFYFRFTSTISFLAIWCRHVPCIFYGDHYLSVSDIRPLDWAPRKCRISCWNFTNMLFISKAISISGLQAPCCFFSSSHYVIASGTHALNRAPWKYRYNRWNFTNILFLTKVFTTSGLSRHIGFSYVGPWQHICIPGLQLKTRIWMMDVAHFGGTFSDHTFPSIFVMYSSAILHFRRTVTSRNHANSINRSDAHENMKVIIENVCCF